MRPASTPLLSSPQGKRPRSEAISSFYILYFLTFFSIYFFKGGGGGKPVKRPHSECFFSGGGGGGIIIHRPLFHIQNIKYCWRTLNLIDGLVIISVLAVPFIN